DGGTLAGGVMSIGRVVVPSNPQADENPDRSPSAAAMKMRSGVRIADLLGLAARMRDRAVDGGTDLLGVFPEIAGGEIGLARLPRLLALGKLGIGKLHVDRTVHSIDGDDVPVLEQRDRSAERRLRTKVTDAEAAACARETSVGDQRNLAA